MGTHVMRAGRGGAKLLVTNAKVHFRCAGLVTFSLEGYVAAFVESTAVREEGISLSGADSSSSPMDGGVWAQTTMCT